MASVGSSAAAPSSAGASAAPAASAAPRRVEYLEVVTGGAEASAPLPMLVAIHGRGDRPETFAGALAGFDRPARVIVPRGLSPLGDGFSWFALQSGLATDETAQGILEAADALASTLRHLETTRPTVGKPVVTGFSQGGALSFALALRHPDLVAAAFPIGGWVPPAILAASADAKGVPPIVALHGEDDARVPIGPTREAVAALAARGIKVELKGYPGVGHSISQEMRQDVFELLRKALPSSGSR
ncbi:phospholipase [Chondromyces crocatus]|uniref:Phospholipase n=1 Tax=Chondromyces crocatus TaxID=52 RepID=A0A0K1ESK3_CHOCO|nr:phospholipase [Chondromyces crocatus]